MVKTGIETGYLKVLDLLPIGIVIIDRNYTVLLWNKCISSWTGIPASEMVGTDLTEKYPSLDKPAYRSRMYLVFKGGPAVIFSPQFHPHFIPAPMPGGGERTQHTTFLPMRYRNSILGILMIDDVTDLVRQVKEYREMKDIAEGQLRQLRLAQDALIESEDTANALLNAITETAVLIEPDGTILAGNETFARRFGGEADSLISKNFYEIIPPDVARDRKARIDNAIARIKPVEFVDERFGRFIENRIYPVTDSKGAVTKAAIYGKDITEQREADQKIRDNEERFRIIFEGQMTGILLIDAATHRIADLNDIAVRMIGYQKEMIVGKVCHRFVCPAEVGRCPVTDLGQDLDRSERVLINTNAERVPILKSVRPIIFGGHRYLIESFTDITELKNAQLALKKSEEQLQAANRKLTLLSGITRHDILNIVSGIATFLYLLDISVPDEPEIKSYIGSIREQIGVISKILAVTLDYESLGIKAPVWINVADVSGKAARDAFTSGEIPVDITT